MSEKCALFFSYVLLTFKNVLKALTEIELFMKHALSIEIELFMKHALSIIFAFQNCSRYGRQNQEISVCQMRNCRKSKNMLEHCDNNNSVLCANNNTTKKFKKENRRSKKEARSSYTSDENVISDGKAKPPLSTNKTSETVVLDSSPAQHSSKFSCNCMLVAEAFHSIRLCFS